MAYRRIPLGHTNGVSHEQRELERRPERPHADEAHREELHESRREPQEMTQVSGTNPSLYTNLRKPKAPKKPKK